MNSEKGLREGLLVLVAWPLQLINVIASIVSLPFGFAFTLLLPDFK